MSAHGKFCDHVQRTKNLIALYLHAETNTTSIFDADDVLRAAHVQVVSALDHFIHELVVQEMVRIKRGERVPTPLYLKFQIPMESVEQGISVPENIDWFESCIRHNHSWKTFQRPDAIAEAIRLVTNASLWNSVAAEMGDNPIDLKQQLKLIVDRRDKIAHEADVVPGSYIDLWPISAEQVEGTIEFIAAIAQSINSVVLGENTQ